MLLRPPPDNEVSRLSQTDCLDVTVDRSDLPDINSLSATDRPARRRCNPAKLTADKKSDHEILVETNPRK